MGLTFLPRLKEKFERAVAFLKENVGRHDEVYLAAEADFQPYSNALKRIAAEYQVLIIADILAKMADLAMVQMGQPVEDPERVALRDLFGQSFIPKAAAEVVRQALEKMQLAGDIGEKNHWQGLELMAAEYLAG